MIAKDTLLVIAATEKGVYVSKDLATSYSRANSGLADSLHVNDITFFGSALIAATENSGIFISNDTGTTWNSFNNNLSSLSIKKVKSSSSFVYLINSAGEIFQSDLINGWMPIQSGLSPGIVPTSITFNNGNALLGTYGDGIFIRPETSGNWTQFNSGLANLNVTSVIFNNQNKVFAGTDGNGVFVSDASTINWNTTSPLTIPFTTTMGLDGSKIQDMAYYAGYTFASCRGQVLATSDNGTTWIEAGTQFNLPSFSDLNKLSFVTTRLFTTTQNNSLYSNGLSELPPVNSIHDIYKEAFNVSVAPNPAAKYFNISFSNPSEKLVTADLYNVNGELIRQYKNRNQKSFEIDFSKGIYFLRSTTNLGSYSNKLIIE
jgi:hypothetical protein